MTATPLTGSARDAAEAEAPSGTEAAAALPEAAVDIRGLTKTYAGEGGAGPKTALRGVDLTVPRGSFFGLLGPNGAGKSTIINILAGLVGKTSGRVRIWDYDIDTHRRAAKSAIGVVPQELVIDPFFTPRQILNVQSGLYGLRRSEYRTEEVLDAMGLTDKADTYSRGLSGGMKRRLLIGKAILHSPPIVVLDEPTAGVDVELRQHLWSYIRALNAAGTTILLTTHYLEEAEQLCDSIAIIDEGEVIACEPTAALLRRLESKEMTVTVGRDLEAVPPELAGFDVALLAPRLLRFRLDRTRPRIGAIIAAIHDLALPIDDLSTQDGRLEDVFLALTRNRRAGARPEGDAKRR